MPIEVKMDTEAARFKEIILRTGFTKKDFAKTIGSSATDISKYLGGKLEIPAKVFRKLNEVYEIDLNWLVSGNGHEPPCRIYPKKTLDSGIEIINIPFIPIKPVEGSAGTVLDFSEKHTISIPESIVSGYAPDTLRAVKLPACSIGCKFEKDDIVILSTQQMTENDIYVLSDGEKVKIRIVKFDAPPPHIELFIKDGNVLRQFDYERNTKADSITLYGRVIAGITKV
jgi:transcriptional regulator with XRE-family HTH domain